MRHHRESPRSPASRVARRLPMTVAASAAVLLALVACSPGQGDDESARTLTIGLVMNSGGSLSPYDQADPNTPLDLVYDGLVRPVAGEGGDTEFLPWLATRWEFIDDFTAIEMELREDVVFSDGTPFDAEAVKLNFEESLKHSGTYASLMGEATVEVTGEHSVIIRYTADLSTRAVLTYLGSGATNAAMISPAALEDPDSIVGTPIGTGPYLFDAERSTPEVELVFVPNEDYWNPDISQWDEIVVTQFSDLVAVLNALKGGQIDFGPVDAATADEVEASGLELNVALGRFSGLYFVDRDGTLLPPLGDVRVRQAISMAFDREAIVDAVENGRGEPGNQALPFRDPSRDDRYPYDPEEARALMAEAGYADGFDLAMPSFNSPYEPAVQQALADIGIRVVYEPAQATEYFAIANSGVWPVLLNIGPVGPFVAPVIEQFYLAADGFYNVLAEPTPEAEELLRAYKYGVGQDGVDAAADLGEYLLDEAWFAVITYPHTLWAYSPDIAVVSSYNPGIPPSMLDTRPVSG